jgi:putative addiction module component (TIGR02574 family)
VEAIMHARELIDEARNLSLDEKLRVVEEIWDSIATDGDTPPLSKWQEAELDRREKLYRQGAEQFSLIYTVESDRIVIHAVFDTRRDPSKVP